MSQTGPRELNPRKMARRAAGVNAGAMPAAAHSRAGTIRPRRAFPIDSRGAPREAHHKMNRPKTIARIENVVFLSRIGQMLRGATQDVVREDLPPDIKRLLGRLERPEARDTKRGEPDPDDER